MQFRRRCLRAGEEGQDDSGGETLGTRCETLPLTQQQQQQQKQKQKPPPSKRIQRQFIYQCVARYGASFRRAMQIARGGGKNNPRWDETFTYLMVNRIQNSPQSGRPLRFSGTLHHFRYVWSADPNAAILLNTVEFTFRGQIQRPDESSSSASQSSFSRCTSGSQVAGDWLFIERGVRRRYTHSQTLVCVKSEN